MPCDESHLSHAFVPKQRKPVVICGKTPNVSDAMLSVTRESLSYLNGRLVGRGGSSLACAHDVFGPTTPFRRVRSFIQRGTVGE